MLKKELTDMSQGDIAPEQTAVIVDSVSKIFTQWQRKEGVRSIFRQQKRTVAALEDVIRFEILAG